MTPSEEAFFKRRRNLIAASILIAFVNFSGVKLEKLSFAGNDIKFSNPQTIPAVLAVALAYFLIRYFQYAHDVEDKGFKRRFLARVEVYLAPYLMKREFRREGSHLSLCYKDLKDIQIDSFTMFNEAMPLYTAAASFVGKAGGVVVDENEMKVSRWELLLPFFRAGLYISFRTRLATDYALPVALAAAASITYVHEVRALASAWL